MNMKRDLYATVRPGSTRARREKLKEALPVLEQALHNGWGWGEIVELAREILGEPNLSVGALKNIRYRYKRLLAKRPEMAAPSATPLFIAPAASAPIAPAAIANPRATEPAAPGEPAGESAVARTRRLQQQEKAQIAAIQQQVQVTAETPNAPAPNLPAAASLSSGPRTVARKIEEIAQALEADSDLLSYPVMSAQEAMALAQDLEKRGMLSLATREFAQYCFDRIFPIYESMERPLIKMRTDIKRWEDVMANFARRRKPYGEIILAALHQTNPSATLEGEIFTRYAATPLMALIREKNLAGKEG